MREKAKVRGPEVVAHAPLSVQGHSALLFDRAWTGCQTTQLNVCPTTERRTCGCRKEGNGYGDSKTANDGAPGQRRQLPDRGTRSARRIHTGGPLRGAPADCEDRDRVHPERSDAGGGRDRGQELRRDQGPAAQGRRTRADGRGHPRSLRRPGNGQGNLGADCRVDQQAGQLFGGLQRARRHRHAAHRLVRHRSAEAEVPAQAGDGRMDRRLCAVGILLRLRTP